MAEYRTSGAGDSGQYRKYRTEPAWQPGHRLHLIEPLGFQIKRESICSRAGMDYWKDLDVTTYMNYEDFLNRNPGAKIYMATTKGPQCLYGGSF